MIISGLRQIAGLAPRPEPGGPGRRPQPEKHPLPHPHADALELVASPMKLQATPAQVLRPPPGRHTNEVPAEIGIDDAARQRLRDIGVVSHGSPPAAP